MTPPNRSRGRGQSSARRRAVRGALAIACGAWLGIGCAADATRSPYGRELYQWSDASGTVRYTSYVERIPVRRMHTMQRVIPGRSAEENAAELPGARLPQQSPPSEREITQEYGDENAYVSDLDERIATLEVAVERDQEILKILISDPAAAPNLSNSDELEEIGRRLPQEQQELRALREERARALATDAP